MIYIYIYRRSMRCFFCCHVVLPEAIFDFKFDAETLLYVCTFFYLGGSREEQDFATKKHVYPLKSPFFCATSLQLNMFCYCTFNSRISKFIDRHCVSMKSKSKPGQKKTWLSTEKLLEISQIMPNSSHSCVDLYGCVGLCVFFRIWSIKQLE